MNSGLFSKLRYVNNKLATLLENKFLCTGLGTTYAIYHYNMYCENKDLFKSYKLKNDDEIKKREARISHLENLKDKRTWDEFDELQELVLLKNKIFPSDDEIGEFNKKFENELRTKFFMYSSNLDIKLNVMISSLIFTTTATLASKVPIFWIPIFTLYLFEKSLENKNI
jgi:hypothetical protein